MNFTRLVPNVYYQNIKDGLKLFVDCLDFEIGHEELKSAQPFCVIEKDGLQMYLFQHQDLAKEHNPEFRLQTNSIDDVYSKVSASQVCIIFQQW